MTTDATVISESGETTESEISDSELPDFSQFIEDDQEDVDLGAILVNALETIDGDTPCVAPWWKSAIRSPSTTRSW